MKHVKKEVPNKYRPFPFWSWNDELDEEELVRQIDWMHENGIGGFFMHARGGLTTPYLGEKWFSCVRACQKRAQQLGMEAYAYDENGWPSGFAGGKLLEDENNRDAYLTYTKGEFDPKANVSYDISGDKLIRATSGKNNLNVFIHIATSTADVCNKDVVKKFIELTHEQYKKNDTLGNLRGFFTDEPQYFRWQCAYTRVLPKYFKETYDEDIFDKLGLLFVEKEGYREFRYRYWLSMHTLMLNAFGKQIYDWCDKNNYKLTGHYVEETNLGFQVACCGGVMPFYEYEHIPGCDWLGRFIGNDLSSKQLGSVAAQLDKKQVMCEMFACVGWDTTPLELKHIAEFLMVFGINIICHHLLPYSEHGQRKRDYPEHYSKVNPWVEKNFREFNDYFSILGQHLSNSKELVNACVLHPIRSAYFDFKDELSSQGWGTKDLDDSLERDINMLAAKHIPYHFIDESILARHGSVQGKKLVVGKCSYDYLILPSLFYTMDKTTKALFKEFVSNGGKVLLLGKKPEYLEGQPFNYDYLVSNTSIEEIKSSLDYVTKENPNIRLTYRKDENGYPYFYIVNLGDETELELSYKGYKSFSRELGEEKIYGNKIHFNKYESMILYPSNEEVSKEEELKVLKLNKNFRIVNKVDNYLTLDFIKYSTDGINYSKPMFYTQLFDKLLRERYKGDLYLKYEFEVQDIPSKCLALIEDLHNLDVKVNGELVEKCGICQEKDLWTYNIKNSLKKGTNSLVLHINYYQTEDVYYALYGENVTETLRNCLAYPSTIEAIYLEGVFGVDGDYSDGVAKDIVIANKFSIIKQPTEVKEFIKDGFPFFRGDIELEQEIDVKDVNQMLVFDERFQLIDVYVNDQFVKRMMFDYKLDLSKHLKVGKNKIKLVLTVSNRNLMGWQHSHEEEPLSTGPFSFELFGIWDEEGNAPFFKKRYSFVKTII